MNIKQIEQNKHKIQKCVVAHFPIFSHILLFKRIVPVTKHIMQVIVAI